jgi:hypothetical protein
MLSAVVTTAMRRYAVPVALALLVALAGCLGPLQTSSPADGSATVPTVSVTGVGEVTVDADLAVVSVSVRERGDTAEAVRAAVAERSDALRAALEDAGVPADAVTTVSFRLQVDYDYGENRREPVGYTAVHTFRVEVAPDRAGEVVDLAVDSAGATVDGVGFTLSDETRADLREEALRGAVANARADADAVADAASIEVVGVRTASVGGSFSPYPYDVRFAESAADGAATSFSPGPVTVTASVSLTYEVRAA